MQKLRILLLALASLSIGIAQAALARQAPALMENLGRGVVAVRSDTNKVFVSWRVLGTDPEGTSFNLYRKTGGGAPQLLNSGGPLTGASCFEDTAASTSESNEYYVRPIIYGNEEAPSGSFTIAANAPVQPYLRVPLQIPASMTMPDGSTCTYSANDCSVGDLDGDGEYEIIVKWDPSNSKDNSQSGYTGNVYLDAYKLDGTRLWRIDLGKNIRAGAHYTQFMVYDLDGDGIAEVACKTADGTIDGVGTIIGDASKDWRNANGYILSGPEFLTIFNGRTGAAMVTVDYVPLRGDVGSWGDTYGNRVDRFLACIAYLDGQRPSLVMCRGYYTRAVLAAWDWRDGQLTQRWVFDSNDGTPGNTAYRGQGNHNLTVADVDGDGKDEIVYGSCTIDDNGKGLYSTGLGHGDAMHVSQMDPSRPDQLVWVCHEDINSNGNIGHTLREAKTGKVLFSAPSTTDAGRAMAGDIDPRYPGYEIWGARANLTSSTTLQEIAPTKPSMNFACWWDGDLLRELLDGTTISKWNWNTNSVNVLLQPVGIASNNSTKATPNLSGDILGDWREEVVWRETDSSALRIYTTTTPTTYRIYTLMHDRQYREAIAWQNVAYNQPPHPSFFLGHDMAPPPVPNIVTSLDTLLGPAAPEITTITPDTGVSATDFITNATNLTLHGTAEAGCTVKVALIGVGPLGTTLADASGNWTLDCTAHTLPEGQTKFITTATDAQNRTGAPSLPYVVTVITTPPYVPAIANITGGDAYIFTGTATPGTLVTVSNTTLGNLGTAHTDEHGIWTLTYTNAALPPGEYTFTAIATDDAGNTSAASAGITINTRIATPVITGIADDTGASATDGITANPHVILKGTATPGDTLTIVRVGAVAPVGTLTVATDGQWTMACSDANGLADGSYPFSVTAANATGTGLASPVFVVTVDTIAPTTVSVTRQSPAAEVSSAVAITFRVTFSENISGANAASFTPVFGGGLTGEITAIAPVDAKRLDVVVGNLQGIGSVRLDLLAAGTAITDTAGNLYATNYTAGQVFNRVQNGDGAWARNTADGLWSDYANWTEGIRAEGIGKTANLTQVDPMEDMTIVLDAPVTIGNITFGDADPATPSDWEIIPSGSDLATTATLTLAVASGAPSITADGMGAGAIASINVPLAGTQGLSKSGTNTVVLRGANTLTGALTVNTGTLSLGTDGTLNIGSNGVTLAATSRLDIAGGNFATEGTVSAGNTKTDTSGMIIRSGSARVGTFRTNSDAGGVLLVDGGTLSIGYVNIQRNGSTTASYTSGFIVRSGNVDAGNVGIGTSNSYGAMSIEGGSTLVSGSFIVANQQTGSRGGAVRVLGGTLVSTNATDGLVLSKNNSNANNVASAIFTGGTTTLEKITLGYDSTVNAGSATVTINGGALYLGAGGIVKKGTSAMATTLSLSSGTLAAKASWTTTHPITLPTDGNITIRAADADGSPANITLSGILSGAGGITKTGVGSLMLTAANNTFTGPVAITNGTLGVNAAITNASTNTWTIGSGGVLVHYAAIARTVALGYGGVYTPIGNTATLTAFQWQTDGMLRLDLDRGDRLTVNGAVTKMGTGQVKVIIANASALAANATQTLAAFASTTLTTSDFAQLALPGGLIGRITVDNGTTLTLHAFSADAAGRFQDWALANNLPAGKAGPADDADNDGIANLLEYYLGLNPLAASSDGMTPLLIEENGERYPAIVYVRATDRSDIPITADVLMTTDLVTWTAGMTTELGSTPNADGKTETVTARSIVPLSQQPRQFFRIQVALAETVVQAVKSAPVGTVSATLTAGTRTLTTPMLEDIAVAVVESSAANTLQLKNAPGQTLVTSTLHYYVEVASGPYEGDRYDLVSLIGNTIALDLNVTSNSTVKGALSGDLTGARIVIREHMTLNKLGGMFTPALKGGATVTLADTVQLYTGTAAVQTYYRTADGTKWLCTTTGTTDAGNTIIVPGAGLKITIRQTSEIAWVHEGTVRTNAFSVPLVKGTQTVANGFPVDITPAAMLADVAHGWTAGKLITVADTIDTNDGNKYYLYDSATWVKQSTTTPSQTNNALIKALDYVQIKRMKADSLYHIACPIE